MIGDPSLNSNSEISLYFHIPFCTSKCAYCHFYVIPDKDAFKKQLMIGLEQEWQLRLPDVQNKKISSIYFGGGTPALIGPKAIGEILSWVLHDSMPAASEPPEVTLEANPENVTLETMQGLSVSSESIDQHRTSNPSMILLLRPSAGSIALEKSLEAIETHFQGGDRKYLHRPHV